jgi:hypothetical protein
LQQLRHGESDRRSSTALTTATTHTQQQAQHQQQRSGSTRPGTRSCVSAGWLAEWSRRQNLHNGQHGLNSTPGQ